MSTVAPIHRMEREDWLAKVPMPVFGPSLGLLGIYLLAETYRPLERFHSLFLLCLFAGVIALVIGIALHICRWMLRPAAFRRDIKSPALSPFLAQVGIALLLLAEATPPMSRSAARMAFIWGAGVTVVTGVWWLYRISKTPFSFVNVTPGWLVPPIALIYIGLLAPAQGYDMLGPHAVTVGLILSSLSLGAMGGRLIKGPPLPRLALPALTIAMAIPGLMMIWIAVYKPGWTAVGLFFYCATLFGYTAGFLGFVIACMRIPFAVSWWGFGMPLTAASIGLVQAETVFHLPYSSIAAEATAFLCVGITATLAIRTCRSGWLQIRALTSI